MKTNIKLSVIALTIVLTSCQSNQLSDTELIQFSKMDSIPDKPTTKSLEWLEFGFGDFVEKPPLFTLNATDNDTKVKLWSGISEKGIYIMAEIFDNLHYNRQKGGSIWDGDAIQFGVDANGDGSNGVNENEIYIGPNDAMYAIGLSEGDTIAWAHYHGNANRDGDMTLMQLEIIRDDNNNITTYKIMLPWEEFNWGAGLSEYVGLSFMFNDTDEGSKQTRLLWGGGVGSQLRPGQFFLLRTEKPVKEFISIAPLKQNIWADWDNATFIVGANYLNPTQVSIQIDGKIENIEVPASDGNFVNYKISIPSACVSTEEQNLVFKTKNGVLTKDFSFKVSDRSNILREFTDYIHQELKTVNPEADGYELYMKHLTSTKAIVESKYNQAILEINTNAKTIELWAEYTQKLLKTHKHHDVSIDKIMNSTSDANMSFSASSDRSLQLYRLRLPANFDPAKTYPAIVDLHGSGNPYALSFISGYTEYAENEIIETNNLEAFLISPWGRGNSGYFGNSGDDIYDCLADVKTMFNIDENRTYLMGMSMGGWGTWYHSMLTPHRWAAVAICSGGLFRDPTIINHVENIKNLPVLIWHGDKDGAIDVENAYIMNKALKRIGNDPKLIIVKNRGHQLFTNDREQIFKWLLSHKRKIDTEFTYYIHNTDFKGRNGILHELRTTYGETPVMSLYIIDDKIILTTTDIPKLNIDLRKIGLPTDKNYSFVWNGKDVYCGKLNKRIVLGI